MTFNTEKTDKQAPRQQAVGYTNDPLVKSTPNINIVTSHNGWPLTSHQHCIGEPGIPPDLVNLR